MAWFGKLLGGAAGMAVGGPLGAIAGIALGAGADKALGKVEDKASDEEHRQFVYFTTTFALLGKLAKADGVVTGDETDAVKGFMEEMNIAGEEKDFASSVFNRAKQSPHTFREIAEQFFDTFGNDPSVLNTMVDLLFRIAAADGKLHPYELKLIQSAAKTFRLDKTEWKQIYARYHPAVTDDDEQPRNEAPIDDSERYYTILGCSKEDSFEDIKQRYRELVSEYHPDIVKSKGLPEEFVQTAKDRLSEFSEAFEKIKAEREG